RTSFPHHPLPPPLPYTTLFRSFPAALLVQTSARRAVANFGRRASRVAGGLKKGRRSAFAHLFRPDRGASVAANSRMAKAIDCLLSWRRCDGGHEQTGIPRGHEADAGRGEDCSCPLGLFAARGCRSWLRPKKDRRSADRNSARRISIP